MATKYPRKKKTAKLAWVIVQGEIHNVSDYSHLLPQQRPYATCPVCHSPVIMRLGKERVFHAAHQPQDICAVTQPETAKHVNAKYLLYQQLSKTSTLRIRRNCDGLHGVEGYPLVKDCNLAATQEIEYIRGWDQVCLEGKLDQFRPDILLLQTGVPIGAIEIFVTHAIDASKAEHLERKNIPWVEVAADDVLDVNGENWTSDKALPSIRYNEAIFKQRFVCKDCVGKKNRYFKEELRKKSAEEARKRQEEIERQYHLIAFRVVDFYYPEGKNYRAIYSVKERIVENRVIEAILFDGNDVLKKIINPPIPAYKKIIDQAFKAHIKNFSDRGHIVDTDQISWQPAKNFPLNPVLLEMELFPKRYIWSSRRQKWYLISYYEKLKWDGYWENRDKYMCYLQQLKDLWRNGKQRGNHNIPVDNSPVIPTGPTAYDLIKKSSHIKDENVRETYGMEACQLEINQVVSRSLPDPKAPVQQNQAYECMFCHQMTHNWWAVINKINKCKCRDCLDKGIR